MGWKKTALEVGFMALDIGMKEYKKSKRKPASKKRKTTKKTNKKGRK